MYTKYGGRVTLAIGVGALVAGALVCSFLTDLYFFTALFLSCVMAVGPCFLVINSMWVVWTWYPTRKGLVTGFLMLGYGGGTSLLTLAFTFLINPSNQTPDLKVTSGNQTEYLFSPEIARRLPMALRIIAGAMAIAGGLALLLVRCKETSQEERKSVIKSSISRHSDPTAPACPSLSMAVRTSAVWLLFFYVFCAYNFALFMLVQYKNYAMTVTRDDQFLAGIGSAAFGLCTVARFFISVLTDYIPFKWLGAAMLALQAAVSCTLPWVVHWPYMYLIWTCLAFICYAAIFTPVTIVCGEIFGQT